MKNLCILISGKRRLFCCLSILLYCSSKAQPPQHFSYDTLITGTGNDTYNFTVPKFNPAMGTLSSIQIRSVVSVNYGFSMTSYETSTVNFSVSIGRKDNISSALISTPYKNQVDADVGTYIVNPNETISEALTTVINRYNNEFSVTGNLNNFVGIDRAGFSYATRTYTEHYGSSHYSYSANANDTVHFMVTYYYYDPLVLATNISSFTASRENDETAKLNWSTSVIHQGLVYEIQKSTNGIDFVTIGKVDEDNTGNYVFRYAVAGNEKTKLYFRLKLVDANAAATFSETKMVDMSQATAGKSWLLYPNPSDKFINIVFDEFKNWQVTIFSANGSLVQQNRFMNSNTAHIDFNLALARGAYFARVVDEQSKTSRIMPFVVR